MKKSLHKMIWRTLLVLACTLFASNAWAANMWILGDPAGGFRPDKGYQMNQSSDNEFWVILYMEQGWNFSFTSALSTDQNDWTSMNGGRLCPYTNDFDIHDGDYTCAEYGSNTGNSFNMDGPSGYYTITMNSTSRNMTIHPISFTVAGSSIELFGGDNAWDIRSANDMTYNSNNLGWYKTYSDVQLSAGHIEFKVLKNKSFDTSYPGNNYDLNVKSAGTYDVTIYCDVNNIVSVDLLLKHTAANFPDENFRDWLSDNCTMQTAGYWTPAELDAVESIDCSNQGIYSLKGIENFTLLTTLNCSGNHLSSIDLSHNAVTNLTAGGQTVDFNNNLISVNETGACFIRINDFKNGLPTVAQSEFDMSRVTWGAGCVAGTGEGSLNGEAILIIDGNKDDGGSFKYNYAITAPATPVTPISIKDNDGGSMEVTVNWTKAEGGVVTGINTIAAGKGEVKGVRYYNLMGVESATPFDGVNIVVKEFSDGTRETSKVVK